MDWSEVIQNLFTVVIIPLLGLVATYLVKFINAKVTNLSETSNNELFTKYLNMLKDTVTECVIATNQTYVNSLKETGTFDAAAQKEAFEKTYSAVMGILSAEAQTYLTSALGDLNSYVSNLIEAKVNENRTAAATINK